MRNTIYLDYAATAPMLPEAVEAMLPYLTESFGNASGVYATGREARRAVEDARRKVAEALGVEAGEILFTSGGTESDNLAIRGVAEAMRDRGRHLITTAVEHHAVLHPVGQLEKQGFEVTVLPTDREGFVRPEDIRAAIRPDTVLISVMTANNETGTVEPIREIGAIARENHIPFHTDAVQAVGMLPLDAGTLKADLMSISAHKFHGPKGVGALYVRKGTRLNGILFGGAQERSLRPGTENVAGIVGMGRAIEIVTKEIAESTAGIRRLRDRLVQGVLRRIPDAYLNGPQITDPEKRLPNHAHFSFAGVDGEALLLRLDLAGIAASAGSACTSGSTEPSHVLTAIGLDADRIRGSIRMTLGRETTEDEIDRTVDTLETIVADLRKYI